MTEGTGEEVDSGGPGAPERRSSGSNRVESLLHGVRFGKFVSVGVAGAAVDITAFMFLAEVAGVPPEVATLVGIETAILLMFAINEHWTFADEGASGRRSLLGRLVKSHGVRAAGSLTQFTVFVVVLWYFFVPIAVYGVGLWKLVAKVSGIGVGMLVNYVFESLFTWEIHREDAR
jgi:putative flippase GtrA